MKLLGRKGGSNSESSSEVKLVREKSEKQMEGKRTSVSKCKDGAAWCEHGLRRREKMMADPSLW